MADNRTQVIQLRDALNIFFKRKNQILAVFGAVVAAVAAYTFLSQPLYESSAQILVSIGRGNVMFSNIGDQTPNIFIDHENVINSEIELLKSTPLIEKTIRDLGGVKAVFPEISQKTENHPNPDQMAMNNALIQFQKSFFVKPGKKSNLITLGFSHPDPQLSAAVLNQLSSNFLDQHAALRKNKKSYDFFQNQAKLSEEKLLASEKELEAVRGQHRITNLEEQKNILLRQRAELFAALNATVSSETEASNRIGELRRRSAMTPENIPQLRQDDPNDVLISTLQSRLVELELQEKSLSSRYTDENRSLQNTREEIRIVRDKLSESESRTYGRRTSGINPMHQTLQQELLRFETEKKALSAKREVLSRQIADFDAQIKDLNAVEMRLNQLAQQVVVDRKNYDLYLTKLEEARISDAMDAEKISNLSLIERASVPVKPASPKVALNLIVGLFIGLFGAVLAAFVAEFMSDRLESPEDVVRVLKLPVLTSIPELKSAPFFPKMRA